MKLNLISLGLLASMALTTPALAHDQLVGTNPEAGATVVAGLQEFTLEFSSELLEIGSGAEVVITAPDGSIASSTCVKLGDQVATLQADLDQVGTHDIAWRVVSSDGHPIEGNFSIEVENVSGYQASGVAEPCLIASVEAEPDQFNYWLLLGSLGLVGLGLFFYLRPRKQGSGK